jgi:hypothetical protein
MPTATRLSQVLCRQQRGLHLLLELFSTHAQLAFDIPKPRCQRRYRPAAMSGCSVLRAAPLAYWSRSSFNSCLNRVRKSHAVPSCRKHQTQGTQRTCSAAASCCRSSSAWMYLFCIVRNGNRKSLLPNKRSGLRGPIHAAHGLKLTMQLVVAAQQLAAVDGPLRLFHTASVVASVLDACYSAALAGQSRCLLVPSRRECSSTRSACMRCGQRKQARARVGARLEQEAGAGAGGNEEEGGEEGGGTNAGRGDAVTQAGAAEQAALNRGLVETRYRFSYSVQNAVPAASNFRL